MEKASVFFKRTMLCLLLAVLVLSITLIIREGIHSPSFLYALILGSLWAAALYFILARYCIPVPRYAGIWSMAICFAVNLIWVLVIRIEPFSDYAEYWDVACALASGAEIPDAWYVAMYPHILGTATFLSLLIRLFGTSVLAVTISNVIMTTLSCGIIWLLCQKYFSPRTAFLASMLWAFAPCKLMLNSLVFSEPIYTLLILVFFLIFCSLEEHISMCCSYKTAVLSLFLSVLLGLLLAVINIIRPIAAILLIAAALWLLLLRGNQMRSLRLWTAWLVSFFIMTAVFRVTVSAWDNHVERMLGQEIASVPWYNIYVGFNEDTLGRYTDEDMDLLTSYLQQGMSANEAQKHMIPHIRERLSSGIDYPKLLSGKLFSFLGADQLGGYTYRFTRSEHFVKYGMVICNIFYYGVLLAGIAGVIRIFRSYSLRSDLLLPIYFLGLVLAHMLVEVSDRYHYSLIPVLIIFASLGFTREERSST